MATPVKTEALEWAVFAGVVIVMLAIDLWASRGDRLQTRRLALIWSIVWIAAGLAFGGFVWLTLGTRATEEYYAAYAMEKGLSIDNLFLFYVIFQSLGVPARSQHKVLFWGILGAVVFRGIFIFLGVAALERWEWVSYLFGATLLYAAWHSFREDPALQEESPVVDWLSKHLPVAKDARSGRFLVRRDGSRSATPLLLALIAIELTDVMFAIDSVPAALSITQDYFIVYSSNLFAILGLRALYLYLSSTLINLPCLHYGLSAVLAFAGLKILAQEWMPIRPLVSIGIVVALIGASVWASLRARS